MENYTFFIQYPNRDIYIQKYDMPNTRQQAIALMLSNSLDYIYRHNGIIGLFCNGKKVRLTKDDFNQSSKRVQEKLKRFDSCIYAEWL